ncbi:MAG TPA: hypothetical protein PLA68_02590 [Panacibacter sp.]|nr:hypothetical protein [Panacibacter sp.]
MKAIALLSVLMFSVMQPAAHAQGKMLFDDETPLDIGLHISIKEVAKTKQDSVYLPHQLYYKNAAGVYDSINAALKSRGNFRLEQCYFPPLWIKLEKKAIKGTLFEGNKKLKLVLPCYNQTSGNLLILKEYICYKLYEVISPYAFKTRLVNIDFTEQRGKKDKHYQLKGILIEDLDATAKRLGGKAKENVKLAPVALQDTGALRFAFFQFMISNTDLSTAYQHNTKLIYFEHGGYFSLPYDFDMSGVVDAPYAVVSQVAEEQLNTQSVRERLYRGWCRSAEVTQFVRNEFLSAKEKLLSIPGQLKGELDDKEINEVKDYLADFFEILKSDNSFKQNILNKCRSAD